MSVQLDNEIRDRGTRFLLFPQPPSVYGYEKPEVVWLSPSTKALGPGPSDDQIYVVDATEKVEPYDYPYLPPYRGPIDAPPLPDADGHYDHLDPKSREFLSAHIYGSLRRVLDIWQSYLRRHVRWHFESDFERLEVIPLIDWENAQSGYGFMEFGYDRDQTGKINPFALNFDVVAHELGHSILFGEMNVPAPQNRTIDFHGFHESCADLVALLSMLHFESVVDRLLHATRGNLYTLNELNRIAELSDNRQIRIAGNDRRLSQVSDEVHDYSRPLTGALFDILIDVFQRLLMDRDLISPNLAEISYRSDIDDGVNSKLQAGFDRAYHNKHFAFKSALADARDIVGERLAAIWAELPVAGLTYQDVARAFLEADRTLGDGKYEEEIVESFRWREIFWFP